MKYQNVISAIFLERPNRFIAHVLVEGERRVAHVKNTGRCKELLIPGAAVYLSVSDNPARKTRYDLIAVEKKREGRDPLLINMDSQIPNDVAAEFLRNCRLFSAEAVIRREVRYGNSRFDFYIEDGDRKAFLEVKGVTLEENGIAMFPDAPTDRGVKHIRELMTCLADGYEAYVLFVLQMKGMRLLRPHDKMHKAFGDALREAACAGVRLFAVDCTVTADSILPDCAVSVDL